MKFGFYHQSVLNISSLHSASVVWAQRLVGEIFVTARFLRLSGHFELGRNQGKQTSTRKRSSIQHRRCSSMILVSWGKNFFQPLAGSARNRPAIREYTRTSLWPACHWLHCTYIALHWLYIIYIYNHINWRWCWVSAMHCWKTLWACSPESMSSY